MTEEWMDILGWDGLYKISNLGNVIRTKRGIMKMHPNHKGYFLVTLTNRPMRKTFSVSRLVALHFIPNPNNKEQVNHINGIKTDNRVENLEWTTARENVLHSYQFGLASNAGERSPTSIFDNDEVLFMRLLHSFGMSVKEIAAEFNAKYCTIWKIIKHINYSSI